MLKSQQNAIDFLSGKKSLKKLDTTNIFTYINKEMTEKEMDQDNMKKNEDECRKEKFEFLKKIGKLSNLSQKNRELKKCLYYHQLKGI